MCSRYSADCDPQTCRVNLSPHRLLQVIPFFSFEPGRHCPLWTNDLAQPDGQTRTLGAASKEKASFFPLSMLIKDEVIVENYFL